MNHAEWENRSRSTRIYPVDYECEEKLMPTRLHMPKDWKRRATRALSNLNRPGVVGACFWCGHQYRRGEYSPETESDHLLQCSEYPQEAKVQMKKRKKTKPNQPEVGIMWLVGNKIIFDSTPLSHAGRYADHLIHEPSHTDLGGTCKKWAGTEPRLRGIPERSRSFQHDDGHVHAVCR